MIKRFFEDIVPEIADSTCLSQQVVRTVYRELTEHLARHLDEGNTVRLTGIGDFTLKDFETELHGERVKTRRIAYHRSQALYKSIHNNKKQ